MKNKIIKILCLLLISNSVNAQNIEIAGAIADSVTQQPLSYGNVYVKNSKDSIISGALMNEKGEFKIKKVNYQKGLYLLVKYMGYEDKKIDINYQSGSKINIDKIFLKQNVSEIKAATVVGKTKYMEQQFDKKVFNISEAKTSSAKNIFDLLRTLPGVTVDQDDNVIYKGTPATIYVDDQPAEYVYPKTEMIPVANVLKIELIDASLRNGAGKGGIINIKMRNITTDGLSGIAQASNNTIGFKDLNSSKEYINTNYKIKKILFFDNMSYNHAISNGSSSTEGLYNFNSDNYSSNSDLSNNRDMYELSNYGGVRYSPDSKTRFRLSGGFYKNKGVYNTDNYFQQNDNSSSLILDKYSNSSNCDYNNLSKWANASFYHSIDSIGKEIAIWGGVQDQGYNETSLKNYSYQYLSYTPVDSEYNFKKNWDWGQTGLYGGLFYNNPINSKTRWNCGWNGWFAYKGHENNIYSQNEIINYPLTSKTKYNEINQTAYWRIGTTIKKWKFDAGVSAQYDNNIAEFTHYNFISTDTLQKVNKPFFNLLPSMTIVFSPDSLQEIKLSYSRSVGTIWYSQLSDFIDKTNPYNWNIGNSKLKPTAYNNLYLGYSYNKENWNVNTDVFYSITNNDISDLTIPVTNDISETISENIAHNSSVGIELASWVSIKNKCDLNFSSSLNHIYISSSGVNDTVIKKKDFGYSFKFNSDFHLSKKTTVTFYINFFSREITFEGYDFDYINSSFSLTHKFFKNKLMLTLGVNNIFDDLLKHGNYYNYNGIVQNTVKNSSSYKPTYFITLQYKFRQGDRGTKDLGNQMKTGK